MSRGDLIKNKRKREGLSAEALAAKLNVTEGKIYKWEKGHNPSDPEEYLRLKEWLDEKLENVTHENIVEEKKATYLSKRRELKNGDRPEVPVFGGYTTLGNIQVFDDDNVKHKIIAKLPAEVFPGCDYAEKAKGDSMYPLIINQALLIGKTCPVKGITYGEKYIIKTKEGMDTTKFVHPGSSPETIKLKAYNKNIPDQEIPIEEIVFVCRIYWIVNPT